MSQAIAAELGASDRPKRTSELLTHLAASHKADRISVGDIIESLGNRSFGVLLVAFAIPNLPPLGIPGLSTVCAVPMIYLALQMLAGKPAPALPRWLHSRSIATPSFRRLVEVTTRFLRRIERLLSPRLAALTSAASETIIGAAVLLLACILVLPIPFGNLLPALGIAILALAMIEKDGVAVLVGFAVTAASVLVVATIAVGSVAIALAGWRLLFG